MTSGCGAPLDGCCHWLSQAEELAAVTGLDLREFCQPQLFRDERIPNTPGVPLHHQLMRDPTVQFSRNPPDHG